MFPFQKSIEETSSEITKDEMGSSTNPTLYSYTNNTHY